MPVMPYKNFTIFYLIIALAHFFSLVWLPQYVAVTKPLIMASLIGFYISTETRQNNIFLLGLIFAMLGDIFLLFEGELFFIIGLASFLLMQWCYVYVFSRNFQKPDTTAIVKIVLLSVISILLFCYMQAGLGDMKLPVLLYVFSILTMVSFAITRASSVKGHQQVVFGALFFLVSDALLAIHKFTQPVPMASYLIMGTYITAQYLIVTGVVTGNAVKK
jgi:uncharacterized membrane protein YhhN